MANLRLTINFRLRAIVYIFPHFTLVNEHDILKDERLAAIL